MEMLRRNGPVVKSVESVLRLGGSLRGERFVEEVGLPNHCANSRLDALSVISAQFTPDLIFSIRKFQSSLEVICYFPTHLDESYKMV